MLKNFLRAGGLFLLTGFGSLAFSGFLSHSLNLHYQSELKKKGERIFVQLNLSRKQTTASNTHYFYTYSFVHDGNKFTRNQEVSSSFYHLHSEGTNVEAMLLETITGRPYVQLIMAQELQNRKLPDRVLLAFILSAIGLVFFVAGILIKGKTNEI